MASRKSRSCCDHCQEATSLKCQRCADGINMDGQPVDTFYCSWSCQKAAWPAHKLVCKHLRARKQLYRAAEFIQAAFYGYRERCFDVLIAKVEHQGKDIYFWEGRYGPQQCLVDFPANLFPRLEDKQAILTYNACGDVIGYMYTLINACLSNICQEMTEVALNPKGSHRHILKHHLSGAPDDNVYEHVVLKVTLEDSTCYALDVAGAQYGHHDNPVMPWATYLQDRVASVISTHEFGWTKRWFADNQLGPNTDDRFALSFANSILAAHHRAVKRFNLAALLWLARENTTIVELLRSPERAYSDKTTALLANVMRDLTAFQKSLK